MNVGHFLLRLPLKNVFENILFELLPNPVKDYPLHWQTIYQEAIKSRHILFDQHEVETFLSNPTPTLPVKRDLEPLYERIILIFSAGNIREMQRTIQETPKHYRELLFMFYLRMLKGWKEDIKNQLN